MTTMFTWPVETVLGTFTVEYTVDPKSQAWTYLWKSPANKVIRGPLGYPFAELNQAAAEAKRDIDQFIDNYLAGNSKLFTMGESEHESSEGTDGRLHEAD